MNQKNIVWILTAVALILLGACISAAALMMNGWDFTKLGTVKYETNTHELGADFTNISFMTDTADILFVPSADGKCRVVCHEPEKERHTVSVNGDTLYVGIHDEREWYEYIGLSFDLSKIAVYLPSGEYGSLYIKESTGDVEIPEDFSFGEIDISASTGDVKCFASASGNVKIKLSTGDIFADGISAAGLDMSVSTGRVTASHINCGGDVKLHVSTGKSKLSSISCRNLISDGDTGSITLANVVASGKFYIERSTGDVKFDGCDAAEIFVETDTGNVTGSLLSEKIFIAETDTGHVDVPRTVTGGKCEIETDTGDIKLNIR